MTKWDFGMHCTSPQHLIDSWFHFAEFWLLTSWKRSVGMVTGFTDGFTTRHSKGICFGPLVDSGHTFFFGLRRGAPKWCEKRFLISKQSSRQKRSHDEASRHEKPMQLDSQNIPLCSQELLCCPERAGSEVEFPTINAAAGV